MGLCDCLHLNLTEMRRESLEKYLKRFSKFGPYIEGFYLELTIDKKLFELLITFGNLKVLQCGRNEDDNKLTAIPSLEVICLDEVEDKSINEPPVSVLCPQRPCNLKKIYFQKYSVWVGNENLGNLNAGLRKLPGAQRLKLHFNNSTIRNQFMNQINREHDMFESVDIETEIITNPVIRDFMS